MKKIITVLLTGLALAGVQSCSTLSENPETKPLSLAEQMEEYTQVYFQQRPEIASLYGVQNAATRELLTHYDPASEKVRRETAKSLLAQMSALDIGSYSEDENWSLKLIKTELKGAILPAQKVEYGSIIGEYGSWFLPYVVSHLSGPHVEILTLLEQKHEISEQADAEAFVKRIYQYEQVVAGTIEKINHDQALGVIPPDFIVANTIANLQTSLAKSAEQHTITNAFREKLQSVEFVDETALEQEVVQAVAKSYLPATKRLLAKLKQLQPLANHHAGVGRLPNGEAFYQAMITHLSDSTLNAEQIHQIGLAEVARIHTDMDRLLKTIGYEQGTVGERMSVLLKDPKYLYPNTPEGKQQLVADMKADLALANEKLPQWFATLPEQEVSIKVVPPHREQSVSGAFYEPPTKHSPGTYWISLYDTASSPSYTLQTLTYHEANPGHHLQTILGLSDSNPLLATIFYSNASAEGWGLYAERLAAEMGIYENDPVDDIGRLQAELHRAVRLVIDTGIHAFGWSREQAIDYYVATEGAHISEAISEVERYVVWPGQALGYKLGELKIIELREQAKKALGDKFDIRSFHDQVLKTGALPLPVLEQKINNWISRH